MLDSVNSATGRFKRFQIEDNIGEAIHLHIDDMRVDFTVDEFLRFSEMIKASLNKLEFLDKYSVDNFDAQFLRECSEMLPELVRIEIEDIELSKLRCILYSNYGGDLNLFKIVSIQNSPAYQFLQGVNQDFLRYGQYNYCSVDNKSRLLDMLESVKRNKYPYKDEYIVLFNGQDWIRDGQHRAAILAHLHGLDSTVKVMRFHFKGDGHKINARKSNARTCLMWFARKVYRKLKRII